MKPLQSLILSCCCFHAALSQHFSLSKEILSNGGGNVSSGSINVSYTIGQTTALGLAGQPGWLLQQGFQTGTVEETATGVSKVTSVLNVWPNPTNGNLNIRIDPSAEGGVNIKLFDLEGRLVFEENHESQPEIQVTFSKVSKGVYDLVLKGLAGGFYQSEKLIIL